MGVKGGAANRPRVVARTPNKADFVRDCFQNADRSSAAGVAPSFLPLDAKDVCKSFNIRVLDAITYNRNAYDDSEEKGLSVMDVEPEGKAAQEIRDIVTELMAMKAIQEDGADRSEEKVAAAR